MPAANAKVLLRQFNQQQYRAFTLNSDEILSLPQSSSVPWIGASIRQDRYRKIQSHPSAHHVKFITCNDSPHAFLWQTTPEKIKQAVRWGIIKTHSITAKTISILGHYRVIAHERAAKGMVSNSQAIKLKLLDVFQDRFEALQSLESLVNQNNTHQNFQDILSQYMTQLENISEQLENYFLDVDLLTIHKDSIQQIKQDIQADIQRAQSLLTRIVSQDNLRAYNRSRGQNSILEFVKKQMMQGLYELQGINQDLSYSKKRGFALTRGELNDYIEEARKEIDEHQADARNAVTAQHHGFFTHAETDLISYDFSLDELPPARQKEVLLAISFIEGWDKLEKDREGKPIISNELGCETLDVYQATRWKRHRNLTTMLKSGLYFIKNFFKNILFAIHDWEEETWKNKDFHLIAYEKLRKHVAPREPMWKNFLAFIKQLSYFGVDIYNGIRNFGVDLVIKMPDILAEDWLSTQSIPNLSETLEEVSRHIKVLRDTEERTLHELLTRLKRPTLESSQATSQLAEVTYPLTGGEQNDILTAIARGAYQFSSLINRMNATDPFAGLLYTASYTAGVGVICFPALSSSLFSSSAVHWLTHFSYSMSSSKLGAALASGSTLSQATVACWDSAMHGPSGVAGEALAQLGENPFLLAVGGAGGYALGYFLVNGINGHQIPWLSKILQEDLGSNPQLGYLPIGIKFVVGAYEALSISLERPLPQPILTAPEHEYTLPISRDQQCAIERFHLAYWLATNTAMIPKLNSMDKFALSRQIEKFFSKEEAKSLKKILYPAIPRSIAFQLVSIPLSYIPVLVRLAFSPILSLAAIIHNKKHPREPMRRAVEELGDMIKKDLNRLLIAATYAVYTPYSLVSGFIKMMTYVITMTLGRITSLFNNNLGHLTHGKFAQFHHFMRRLSAILYPTRALKSTEFAHPTDTLRKAEISYLNLLETLARSKHGEQEGAAAAGAPPMVRSLFLTGVDKETHPDIDLPQITAVK